MNTRVPLEEYYKSVAADLRGELFAIRDADARLAIESDAVVTVEGAVDDLAGSASLYIDPLCDDPDHAGTGRPCGFSVSPREARVLAARLLRAAEKAEGGA